MNTETPRNPRPPTVLFIAAVGVGCFAAWMVYSGLLPKLQQWRRERGMVSTQAIVTDYRDQLQNVRLKNRTDSYVSHQARVVHRVGADEHVAWYEFGRQKALPNTSPKAPNNRPGLRATVTVWYHPESPDLAIGHEPRAESLGVGLAFAVLWHGLLLVVGLLGLVALGERLVRSRTPRPT